MEGKKFDSLLRQQTRRLLYISGFDKATVCDEQRATKPRLARQSAKAFERADAENDACARLKVECLHRVS
jgi:hypothetical protein